MSVFVGRESEESVITRTMVPASFREKDRDARQPSGNRLVLEVRGAELH